MRADLLIHRLVRTPQSCREIADCQARGALFGEHPQCFVEDCVSAQQWLGQRLGLPSPTCRGLVDFEEALLSYPGKRRYLKAGANGGYAQGVWE
jgi:hypothetical protein